jgi:uncharacterized LabA/DUF88 family protein
LDRNIRDKEKGVDMEMGMDVVERLFGLFEVTPPEILVIAAGDADFKGIVERAKRRAGMSKSGSGAISEC